LNVPVLNNSSLLEYQGWTLRTRAPERTPARLLLMLHGWTGDENSMWVFARNMPVDYFILAPRGIHIAPQGGFSWRPMPSGTFGRPSLAELSDAAQRLIGLVDSFQHEAGVDASTFDVIGFSQGAALSNVLTCLYPARVRKAGILAGFMPSGMDEIIAQRPPTARAPRWRCSSRPARRSRIAKPRSGTRSAPIACARWRAISNPERTGNP
jgi:predicted esterase